MEKVNKSSKLVDLAGKVSKGDLQGFLIDVIDELSKEAQFEYDIYLRPDRKYANVIEELKNQVKSYTKVYTCHLNFFFLTILASMLDLTWKGSIHFSG